MIKFEKKSLKDLLEDYSRIIVPDIQRDYVMGSGGTKLTSLLDAIKASFCNKKKDFNFSCVMGYVNENNQLYVYDGQQRLATLVYSCANMCQAEKHHKEIELLKKFEFKSREEANSYLLKTLSGEKREIKVVDFTTYSIKKLLEKWKDGRYCGRISMEYLMEKVKMDLVIVEKASDAEQFFMDLNDGLDLKEYETYKAELFHKAQELMGPSFTQFALSFDHEWLNFFEKKTVTPQYVSEEEFYREEIEVLFVKFCFTMMRKEETGNSKCLGDSSLEWVEKEHLCRLKTIMDRLIKMESKGGCNCIIKSFEECLWSKELNAVRGVFWNLDDCSYEIMVHTFIKDFYDYNLQTKTASIKNEAWKDAILWAYISNISQEEKKLKEYLKYLKILLNNNLIENHDAYYNEERRIWYSKFSAYGIPQYYSGIRSFANNENKECSDYLDSVIELNKIFCRKQEYSEFISNNNKLNDVITQVKEVEKQEGQGRLYGVIRASYDVKGMKEFGIENSSLKEIYKSKPESIPETILCSQVKMKWPTYCKNYKQQYSFEFNCRLLPKVMVDFLIMRNANNQIDNRNQVNNWLIYVKCHQDIMGSWIAYNANVCYPKKDDNNKNFLSANSTYYSNPIARKDITECE